MAKYLKMNLLLMLHLENKHINCNRTCNICFLATNSNTIHKIKLLGSGLGDHSTENRKNNIFKCSMCLWIHMQSKG